jgi:hypothetical protein
LASGLLIALALWPLRLVAQEAAPEGQAEANAEHPQLRIAAVSSLQTGDLEGFEHYPPQIQHLVGQALALTKRNLTYTFGSADPALGGMDCSGTIFHVLQAIGIKDVPRQSDHMAQWVARQTLLHRPGHEQKLADPQFAPLNPGDLLFWSGTYQSAPRQTPVTHVMLYLGKLKSSRKPVLFGASDGRVYEGQRRTGVSVFDFTLPKAGGRSSFYGFGLIPGIGNIKIPPPEPPLATPTVAASESQSLDAASTEPPAAAAKPSSSSAAGETAAATKESPCAPKETAAVNKEPAAPKEEVRKALAAKSASESKAKAVSSPKKKAKAPPKKK